MIAKMKVVAISHPFVEKSDVHRKYLKKNSGCPIKSRDTALLNKALSKELFLM